MGSDDMAKERKDYVCVYGLTGETFTREISEDPPKSISFRKVCGVVFHNPMDIFHHLHSEHNVVAVRTVGMSNWEVYVHETECVCGRTT